MTSTELSIQTQAAPPAVAGSSAALSRFSAEQIQAANFESGGPVMALAKAEAIPLPLNTEYWSPQEEGESLRCYVAGVQPAKVIDPTTGEIKTIDTAFLLEVSDDGKIRKWMCSSRILVGNIRDAIDRGQIVPNTALTPIQITYRGQKKNRNNALMSKRFEILPLVVGGAA